MNRMHSSVGGMVLGLAAVAAGRLPAQESVHSGVFVTSGLNSSFDMVTAFETNAGRNVSIINYFMTWDQMFATSTVNAIRGHGSIPLLSWEPWGSQPDSTYALTNLLSGAFDAYITNFAGRVARWRHPLFLRFAHEMNGDWYPWCEGVNGNAAGDYVKAWRYVRDHFTRQGATNVTWVWCVNRIYAGSTPIGGLYPGDNYVDWISLDCYNRLANGWQEFSTLAHATCTNLIRLAPGKPILVAEAGCNEEPPNDKGLWFRNALTNYLPAAMPRIKAWVYFNYFNPDGNVWYIDTSTNALAGYRTGIGVSYYASNRFGSLAGSPIQPLTNDAASADTMAPFVSLIEPRFATVEIGSTCEIVATSSDKSGVTNVSFHINGVKRSAVTAPPYLHTWTVPATTGLVHTLMARSFDQPGNNTTSSIQVVAVDTTPPELALVIPVTNSVAAGTTVEIRAESADTGGVHRVEFLIDGELRQTEYLYPYQYFWPVPAQTGTAYLITAIAYDPSGNASTAALNVTARDLTPPSVGIVLPATNSVGAGLTNEVRAEATDTSGIHRIEFFIDGALRQTEFIWPYQYFWPVPAPTGASYVITAVAHDTAGNAATAALQVVARDLTPPVLVFVQPATNFVQAGTTTELRMDVTDDTSGVDRIEIFVDDVLRQTERIGPYQYFWPVPAETGVTYRVAAVAYDGAENSTTGALQLTSLAGFDFFILQITNPAQRGFAADPDGDGYRNLLEYVTGGNPTNADTSAGMRLAWTSGTIALRFTRNTNSTDTTLIVEGGVAATNNSRWTGIATNKRGSWGGATNVTETGGSPATVTVRDTAPAATNRHLRLRVTQP